MNLSVPGSSHRAQPPKLPEESQSRSLSKTSHETNVSSIHTAQSEDVRSTTKKTESKRQPYSKDDIMNQLLSFGKSPNVDNMRIGMTMLSYGVPLNQDYFEIIDNLMKGKTSSKDLESIVLSIAKNLKGNGKSISVLKQFLSNELDLTGTVKQLQQNLQALQAAMHASKDGLSPAFTQHLAAIVAAIDEKLQFYRFDKKNMLNFKVEKYVGLMKESKLFLSLLKGMDKKILTQIKDVYQQQSLKEVFEKTQKSLEKYIDHSLAYLVLSKESQFMIKADLFHFWQIPNLLASPVNNMDILIQKRNNKQNSQINEDKTTMIIKFETENIGELSIVINVIENTLIYTFNSKDGETKRIISSLVPDLIKQMEAINYKVKGVKYMDKKIPVKELLCPNFDLDRLTHISTEA